MSIDAMLPLEHLSGPTMGTRFSAQFPAPDRAWTGNLQDALQQAVDRVDQQMSPWITTSVVNQINNAPVGAWIALPPEAQAVLHAALRIEVLSQGSFSMAVGQHSSHHGFGPGMPGLLDATLPVPPRGRDSVYIYGARLRKLRPVQIDLCGIAKGFGVDELARVLLAHGITDYMVSIDGELRCAGSPDGVSGWKVGLEQPSVDMRQIAHVLECYDLSLATSGGYRNFKERIDGPITHTIAPKSGKPLAEVETSVTVAHQDCMMADAWATAFLVMGVKKGLMYAEDHGLHVLFMDNSGPVPVTNGSGIFAGFAGTSHSEAHRL
ncbi:FAD:protein FMN transferase [Parasedimentitalea marina]|nr:FAD:protein FMN transferase [Parasedimentitalea marina]